MWETSHKSQRHAKSVGDWAYSRKSEPEVFHRLYQNSEKLAKLRQRKTQEHYLKQTEGMFQPSVNKTPRAKSLSQKSRQRSISLQNHCEIPVPEEIRQKHLDLMKGVQS